MENTEKPLVLVVDDHMPAVKMISRLFLDKNYQVEAAYDGEEALKQAKRLLPDLILLDVMMPKINGFQVLQHLRASTATQNIPTILITAKDAPADVEYGLQLGADDYLSKPFNPRELLARAQSKIEARKLKDALQRRTQDMEALLRVSEELKHHLNVNDLLKMITYLALDLLPRADVAAIYRLGDKRQIIDHYVSNNHGDHEHPIKDSLNSTHFKKLYEEKHSILWPQDTPLISDFESGMAVAMEHGDELHGIFLLLSNQPFDHHDLRLFEGISRQATLAVRNAELYEVKVNYAEHLEEMVAERTQELQSAQELLFRSEKLASIGRLAAGIAHEINNPLFPIRINLEHMIEDIKDSVPIRIDDVEETLNSVERISRIVSQLLEFTGKRRNNSETLEIISIKDVMRSVLSLSQKFLEKEKVQIIDDLPALPMLYGNHDQLEQVFLNLILNANAAMKAGGTLTITGEVVDNEIVLQFKDTGSGIPEDIIGKIFEPFVSTKEDGTGLGLFISHTVIENHHGVINAESEVGKGTTFTIRLPALVDELETETD